MLTNFGKFCRKLRIDRSELLIDMAEKLNVSTAFLSSVENGKKKPPVEWKDIIATSYNLDQKANEEFNGCFFEARNINSIDISTLHNENKDLMLAFARKIDTLGEERLSKIKRIING